MHSRPFGPQPVEIVALFVSPVHAYEGRPSDGPRPDPVPVARDQVEVRAGLGLVGDRYFNHAAHRQAAVTVFDAEALDDLSRNLGLAAVPDPLLVRRNIVLRGFPVDALASGRDEHGARFEGAVFALDSGDGQVRFQAHRPANPCAWMDVVLAPGAFRGLRGRGGVRCVPLDDGVLRRGPATLTVEAAQNAAVARTLSIVSASAADLSGR
jgi:MOSC domain-containing protein YiiM